MAGPGTQRKLRKRCSAAGSTPATSIPGREERLDLGREEQLAPVDDPVVERLHAEAVACEEEALFRLVPHGEGEDAVQPGGQRRRPTPRSRATGPRCRCASGTRGRRSRARGAARGSCRSRRSSATATLPSEDTMGMWPARDRSMMLRRRQASPARPSRPTCTPSSSGPRCAKASAMRSSTSALAGALMPAMPHTAPTPPASRPRAHRAAARGYAPT